MENRVKLIDWILDFCANCGFFLHKPFTLQPTPPIETCPKCGCRVSLEIDRIHGTFTHEEAMKFIATWERNRTGGT